MAKQKKSHDDEDHNRAPRTEEDRGNGRRCSRVHILSVPAVRACPTCGAVSQPVLDPAALVWREFAALARRLEDEVHVLARAYGWSEPEILALSEQRRRRYVERVNA